MRRPSPLAAIFLTVFLDLLAFGLIIPDIQLRGRSLGLEGFGLGLTIALYSIAQLVFAPILGRLSDRIGRRRVLLTTCSLAVVASLVYATSSASPLLLGLARVLQGIAGANLGVAYALITDVTGQAGRAKAMGLVGAAFGMGFILGPPVGAWLVAAGGGAPVLLGSVAACLAAVNVVFVALAIQEPETRSPAVSGMLEAIKSPRLPLLLSMFFVANFAHAQMESTFFLMSTDVYRLDQRGGAMLLVFVGVILAFTQVVIVRRIVDSFGEVRLLRFGYLLQAPTLALMPVVPLWAPALVVMGFLAVGSGFVQPSLSSLISSAAPIGYVGGVFGVTQGLGALARILGPIAGNSMYSVNPMLPYAVSGGLMLVPIGLSLRYLRGRSTLEPAGEPVS